MGKQGGDDPVMKISLIGSKIEDGLYATIDVGVNPKARQNPQAVNTWTAEGGKPIPNSPWAGYPDTYVFFSTSSSAILMCCVAAGTVASGPRRRRGISQVRF